MKKTTEDYLKTILLLREREGSVRSIALAEAFGVSKPTVCKIVKDLLSEGYITKDGSNEIALTGKGEKLANETLQRNLPTCHRASFDSFLEDVDYLAAIEHSDGITRRQYQKDAAKIAEVQRGILATSQNEEPFDVFICYKESENDNSRTRDSLMAQEIYYQLTEQGRRVFFSRITLEDKAGTEYEPYIFAALNSAKVMIVVTTSAEHANAVWVKNEWSRFLSLMRKDRSKLLLPCYRDMDPYDLPEALSVLQSYDMSKIGFIQDLIRGENKVMNASKLKETVRQTVVIQQGNANVEPLLERAFMFLEDGEWENADEFFEQVLNLEPKNAEAYLGKLMAELHVKTRDALKDQPEPFDNRNNYKKAYRFGDNALKTKLKDDTTCIRERNELARREGIYRQAIKKRNNKRYQDAIELFGRISGFKDADKCKAECERKIEEIKAREEVDRQERERKAEEVRIAVEKAAKKRKRTFAIVTPILVACIAFVIVLTTVIIPNQKYNAAVELYNAGKYEEAIAAFTALDGYKDSAAQIEKCETAIKDEKYASAVELYTAGKYEEAIAAFTALDGYKDSAEQIEKCETAIKDEKYAGAVALYTAGKYEEAIAAFTVLNGYKDSAVQIEKCETAIKDGKYVAAVELYNAGKYEDAIAAFTALGGYKDSAAKIEEIKSKYYKQLFSNATVGSTVFFGSYEQDNNILNGKEDIEWIVLAKEGNRVLVISKYALDCQSYNSSYSSVTWETCTLRKWLNGTFYKEAFGSSHQKMIGISTVTADKNPSYSTSPGNNTSDKVFLLSITEVNKYFSSDEARKCAPTDYAIEHGVYIDKKNSIYGKATCFWWLRSPGRDSIDAANVRYDGSVHHSGYSAGVCYVAGAVRPAMWIDIGG